MTTKKGKAEKSLDKEDIDFSSIVEETSAELKNIEHSPERVRSRKSSNPSLKRTDETGKEDGSSTLTVTNNGDNNREGMEIMSTNYNSNVGNFSEELSRKEKWRQDFRKFRRLSGKFVNDSRVQYAIIVCIFVNAIMMGLGTYDFIKEKDLVRDTFDQADLIFLIIFTIELLLQFIYHGPRLFMDGWLVFDLIVIAPSWILYRPDEEQSEVQIFRMFRIFRAFRLITRVKIMKDLVVAIGSVLPRMSAICLMLALIFYIFAVMFTQLFSDATYQGKVLPDGVSEGDPIMYFKYMDQSMLTLFQLMTMDEWATIVRDITPSFKYAWFFMIFFVVLSGFIVVNLVVAVICDAIGSLSDDGKAKLEGRYEDSDSEESRMELREQLDIIEDQIGDLTRIQARTFHTLQYLTQQLRVEKEKSVSGSTTSSVSKAAQLVKEDSIRRNSGEGKRSSGSRRNSGNKFEDKRSMLMKKTNSGERSRRKGFAQAGGFGSRRKKYTDTWTQEGSDKSLRRAMISNFAKSARELKEMREKERTNFSNSSIAKSLRELKVLREEEEFKMRNQEEMRKKPDDD